MSNKYVYVIIGEWYDINKDNHKIKDYDIWVSCVFTDYNKAYSRLCLLNELAVIKDVDALIEIDENLPSIEYLKEGDVEYGIESSILYE